MLMEILLYYNDNNNIELRYLDDENESELGKLEIIRDSLRVITQEYDKRLTNLYEFDIENPT